MEPRRVRRGTAVLAGVAAAAAALGLSRWGRVTRATHEEKRAELPGDDVVADPMWQMTRAVTIDRPPSDVWPWLVQMGYPAYRAGWYAPYWLDRFVWHVKERSAERIVAELQTLAAGDRIPDSPDWSAFFTVRRVEPERALVLLSTTHPLALYTDVRFGWSFVLVDLGATTRLVVRARVAYSPVWPAPVVWLFFHTAMTLGDFAEAGAMLTAIKRRAERATTGTTATAVRRDTQPRWGLRTAANEAAPAAFGTR
jgi:hypothetical protein